MTKAPSPSAKDKRNMPLQKRHKKFHYTSIADRLRTVTWSYDIHLTGVVKTVYEIPTFQLTAKKPV